MADANSDEIATALRDLGSAHWEVRDDALYTLVDQRVMQSASHIRKLLTSDPELIVRASAAEAIGLLGDKDALPALFALLDDLTEDDVVRAYAAIAIGQLTDADHVSAIFARAVAEARLTVKAELLGSAYLLGSEEALASLCGMAEDSDERLSAQLLNIFEALIASSALASRVCIDQYQICAAANMTAERFAILHMQAARIQATIQKRCAA